MTFARSGLHRVTCRIYWYLKYSQGNLAFRTKTFVFLETLAQLVIIILRLCLEFREFSLIRIFHFSLTYRTVVHRFGLLRVKPLAYYTQDLIS